MVRYTRDLHGFILGLSLAHLLGIIFCCPVVDEEQGDEAQDQGLGRMVAREKLRAVLRTWEGFGLETGQCLSLCASWLVWALRPSLVD